jgi:hypothetical protein
MLISDEVVHALPDQMQSERQCPFHNTMLKNDRSAP